MNPTHPLWMHPPKRATGALVDDIGPGQIYRAPTSKWTRRGHRLRRHGPHRSDCVCLTCSAATLRARADMLDARRALAAPPRSTVWDFLTLALGLAVAVAVIGGFYYGAYLLVCEVVK